LLFGEDEYAAFIEVFGQAKKLLIDLAFVHDRAISLLEPKRKLRLVDITGSGDPPGQVIGPLQVWNQNLSTHPTLRPAA
jgi:hypothetical protein